MAQNKNEIPLATSFGSIHLFNKNVSTDGARRFLNLIDQHFPKSNTPHAIFSRISVKEKSVKIPQQQIYQQRCQGIAAMK